MVITCEEWRDIEGYEGLYQVSNLGNVRSITRSVTYPNGGNRVFQGQELSKICAATGYYQVGLSRNGKVKVTNIHRLVAVAFIPNPENKPHVNHIDANKKNNDCRINHQRCLAAEERFYNIKEIEIPTVF